MLASIMKFDEPMAIHTTFGIGGSASCMVYPDNRKELSKLLKYANRERIPAFFTGSGSNILVWDEGFDGFVISLRKTFKRLQITENYQIIAESGVMLGTLVKEAIRSNIAGLESLIGVPGTLGGALIMNAGAFGSEISNYFIEAQTMTLDGRIKTYRKNEVDFSYRHSTFPKDEMLIEATFNCHQGLPEQIQAHHPSEVVSTIQATKSGWERRIISVFQPHLFTRTRDFYQDFAHAFLESDVLIVTDIYQAREMPIPGITAEMISTATINMGHKHVEYIPDQRKIATRISEIAESNDIIITMGAGDIWRQCERIHEALCN